MTDPAAVAAQLRDAYARQTLVPQPTATDPAFDLAAGYAVERELVRMREADGHRVVGLKVGFANKAVWRALKLDTLVWAKSVGGVKGLIGRSDANTRIIADWVARTPWIDFLAKDPAIRSNTSVCLKVVDPAITKLAPDAQAAFVKALAASLEKEDIAYDIDAYRDAPPGLRIWCGATIEARDVEALTQWLDWAFAKTKDALPKAA